MTAGDEAVVWMDLRHDGSTTWDLDRTRIGTQDPQGWWGGPGEDSSDPA
jgi:hypothetical protein